MGASLPPNLNGKESRPPHAFFPLVILLPLSGKPCSVFRRKVDESGLLSWLDFFEGLLDASGSELRQEYCLDGTHLGPSYLGLLEMALNDVWRERA